VHTHKQTITHTHARTHNALSVNMNENACCFLHMCSCKCVCIPACAFSRAALTNSWTCSHKRGRGEETRGNKEGAREKARERARAIMRASGKESKSELCVYRGWCMWEKIKKGWENPKPRTRECDNTGGSEKEGVWIVCGSVYVWECMYRLVCIYMNRLVRLYIFIISTCISIIPTMHVLLLLNS
jgi:hypothetical protein